MISLLFNRFTLYAALAAMAVAGAYAYRSSLIKTGYDQGHNVGYAKGYEAGYDEGHERGVEQTVAQVQEAENDRLRELLKENSRLVGVVQGLNDVAQKQKLDIAAFRARQRSDAQRLRDQEAEHQRRLAAASSETAIRYASFLDGHIEECRSVVADLAGEAASCASTAKTLIDYINLR